MRSSVQLNGHTVLICFRISNITRNSFHHSDNNTCSQLTILTIMAMIVVSGHSHAWSTATVSCPTT